MRFYSPSASLASATASLALLLTKPINAGASLLQSNQPQSPQRLSDTTSVCTASQGRTATCEVELDVPASCITDDTSNCPIVFFFHGAGGTNNGFAKNSGIHDHNVIGVYPQGENGWNTGPKNTNTCTWDDYSCTTDPDEGAFISSIIYELRLLGARGNIYLIGNSNGAALAHRLAANANMDDLPIKGIVTKVTQLLASPERSGPGQLNYNQPKVGGGPPVSVLNLMGENDLLIPYEGGTSGVFGGDINFQLMSALDSMSTWAAHNGCSGGYTTASSVYGTDGGTATFYDYSGGCDEGIIVEHYVLHGAGHSFGGGATLDGVAINYDLAYDFISRVEAGGGGDGGGGPSPPSPPPTASTPNPSSSPTIDIGCSDDPTWAGKFNTAHTCEYVSADPTVRCRWESSDGTLASEACKATCGSCTHAPTVSVTTLSPTTASVCGSSLMTQYDFKDQATDLTVSPFLLLGGANDPWAIDMNGGCGGSNSQLTAGAGGNGVDRNSIVSINIPPGATEVSYYYSHPGGLSTGDGEVFQSRFRVNGAIEQQERYESDPLPATCAQSACLEIPAGATSLEFRCRTRQPGQYCSIDHVQFYMDISTLSPTLNPTKIPTKSPTSSPVTASPTPAPTNKPTLSPVSSNPTPAPTNKPTPSPVTLEPTPSPIPRLEPIEFTNQWTSSYADGEESLIYHDISTIMNYQPSMSLPHDAQYEPVDCPHLEAGLIEWNDQSFAPPADGSDILIPPSSSVIIRAGQLISTPESPYGRITIPESSRLIFDDTGAGGPTIELDTLGITVEGALEAGSSTCRIEGNIKITLHGEYGNAGSVSDRHLSVAAATNMGLKGIFVSDIADARMDLHGKLYHPTWTRLAAVVPGPVSSTPSIRNREIFLQDCVNWPDNGKIIVTTSHVKDTRGYNFNEEATIATSGVQCVVVDGREYGKITLTSPLEHYHHAGEKEYQCEVGLLSRNIVIQGNDRSDPIDDTPLECDSTTSGWTKIPCPDTFLTGLGGHTIVVGQARGRLRGVEFHRMGMTNVMGRYPVHFHHHDPEAGSESMMTDCSVHRSYFRAISIHDAFNLKVERNVAYDVTGHAFYLESGVEEYNYVQYNLAAFVHPINGAQIMPSNVVGNTMQSESILVPADHSASGFYISNAHNYVVGNAASGGWAGIQFPVLPEPADKMLRFNGVVPKDRPSLLITGNSVHSSSWFAQNSGAVYEGGSLYWAEDDLDSETLIYNAGRVSSERYTRYTKDDNGNDDFFRVYNTTVWLANIGITGWGKRAEINGFEVSDFQNRALFVLFSVWMNSVVINCRSSNANHVPDPGIGFNENLFNNGKSWSGFFTYDHLMKHILTNWAVSNCGGAARGLSPWVEGGDEDTGNSGFVTIPVNGLAPEVQLVSSGMKYNWDSLGGEEFVNESIFFAASGSDDIYSMQYQSNWEDSDGSWTNRVSAANTSTVMGPARAGNWWHLDSRPGKCEIRDGWKFPQQLCDKDDRHLGSMFTVVMPQVNQQGSAVLAMLDPNANARKTRQGSMTHFGLVGDSSVTTCTPPQTCGETTARSWDPDLTGPYNHEEYGGWYLSFDQGTPAHLSIQKIQLDDDTTMIQAMTLPPGTASSDVSIYAESRSRTYDFALANSLAEVRSSIDKYYHDEATNTLYWRVIAGYVNNDGTYGWIDRASQGVTEFSREGLHVTATTSKSQLQIHIKVNCVTDVTGAFCETKPSFLVPEMGCPDGQVVVAIDKCGLPCELLQEGCSTPPPTHSPTSAPTSNEPTSEAPTSNSPTMGCLICSDEATPWMITQSYECPTAPKWLIKKKCNKDDFWINNKYCEQSCQAAGFGYHDISCCSSAL